MTLTPDDMMDTIDAYLDKHNITLKDRYILTKMLMEQYWDDIVSDESEEDTELDDLDNLSPENILDNEADEIEDTEPDTTEDEQEDIEIFESAPQNTKDYPHIQDVEEAKVMLDSPQKNISTHPSTSSPNGDSEVVEHKEGIKNLLIKRPNVIEPKNQNNTA